MRRGGVFVLGEEGCRVIRTERQRALEALHAAGRLQVLEPVPLVTDDEPTAPGPHAVAPPAPLRPLPAASTALDPDRRIDEHAIRLRERLGAVRPALERLRAQLVRASLRVDAPMVELARADVERALVHARRSVRALASELADLEREARALADAAEHTLGAAVGAAEPSRSSPHRCDGPPDPGWRGSRDG